MILRLHPTPQTLRLRMAEAESEVERRDGSLGDGARSLRQRTPCPGSGATQHRLAVPSLPQCSGGGDRGPCVVEHERHELDDRPVNRVESTIATSRHRAPDQPRTDSSPFGRRTKACRHRPTTTRVRRSPGPRRRHGLYSGRTGRRFNPTTGDRRTRWGSTCAGVWHRGWAQAVRGVVSMLAVPAGTRKHLRLLGGPPTPSTATEVGLSILPVKSLQLRSR